MPNIDTMDALHLTVASDPSPDDRRFLEGRLYEFNSRQVGKDDGQLLSVWLRDAQNEIVAGLLGWTWAGACEFQTLWVQPELRGQGCGRRLVLAAEEAARARGAGFVMVTTYSFQAPGFYEKLGYEIVGRTQDFPPGHQHFHLRKPLR